MGAPLSTLCFPRSARRMRLEGPCDDLILVAVLWPGQDRTATDAGDDGRRMWAATGGKRTYACGLQCRRLCRDAGSS